MAGGAYQNGAASDADDDYTGASPVYTSSSSTVPVAPPPPTPPSVLLVEAVDQSGDTWVVLVAEQTITMPVQPGAPLPSADTTMDPYGILRQPQSTSWPTYNQKLHYSSSTTSPSSSRPTSAATSPASSADSGYQVQQTETQTPPPKDGDPPVPIAIFVVIPIVVVLAIIAAFLLLLRRKRRRARSNEAGAPTQQMKMRSPEDGPSHPPPGYLESTTGLLLPQTMAGAAGGTGAGLSAATTQDTTLSRTNTSLRASQNPIILGTNMQSAYLTGLDTSDAISTTSSNPLPHQHQQGHEQTENRRSIDATSLASEEPPPPYRPRSVPSISRDSSLRNPRGSLGTPAALATLDEADLGQRLRGLGHGRLDGSSDGERTPTAEARNPFDDPEGDVSDSDTVTPVRVTSPFDDGFAVADGMNFGAGEDRR